MVSIAELGEVKHDIVRIDRVGQLVSKCFSNKTLLSHFPRVSDLTFVSCTVVNNVDATEKLL